MSELGETDDSGDYVVDLADFIQDRSSLVVVMGVFAAVAVYISDSAPALGAGTESQLMYTTGFVSALGMTLLFLVLVYKELADEVGSWHHLHHAHYRLDNLPLAFFTLFNIMLILSISYLITRYEPVLFMLLLIATLFAGGGLVLRTLYEIGKHFPQTVWARISVISFFSAVVFLVSNYIITEYLSGVELATIQQMSLTDPMPVVTGVVYVFAVSVRMVAALSALTAIIGIPVLLLDQIRRKFQYDNPE